MILDQNLLDLMIIHNIFNNNHIKEVIVLKEINIKNLFFLIIIIILIINQNLVNLQKKN